MLESSNAYIEATEVADADLKTTYPIRFGLALKYSEFYCKTNPNASQQPKLDDAIAELSSIHEKGKRLCTYYL